MATIYVKAVKGRRVFFEGKPIPEDTYVPVSDTPYMRRLISHWGDVEQKDSQPVTPKAPAAPEAAPEATPPATP